MIADEGGSNWQLWFAEAGKILQVLVGLPGRTGRVLTTVERGELNVQAPLLEIRTGQLEHSVGRINGGLAFAALLVAGNGDGDSRGPGPPRPAR